MKILLLDDDERDVPVMAEVWRQKGHEVVQVVQWQQLSQILIDDSFNSTLIDLMIPALDIPASNGGFTTGQYIYEEYIYPKMQDKPFAVFSSAVADLGVIKEATLKLARYKGFRGYFKKGYSTTELLEAISK